MKGQDMSSVGISLLYLKRAGHSDRQISKLTALPLKTVVKLVAKMEIKYYKQKLPDRREGSGKYDIFRIRSQFEPVSEADESWRAKQIAARAAEAREGWTDDEYIRRAGGDPHEEYAIPELRQPSGM